MPCFIKSVYIKEISGGEVIFGGPIYQSPISSSKSTTGPGSGNIGPFQITNTGFSSTTAIPVEIPGSSSGHPFNFFNPS
ncbi:spore germination protein [Rossellomorea vietnamensis]|uniref:Spore germination protein n=1 Tax=Rossellomorea vietnamensis TaxID=218284 RepID=A0A5D4MG05_9BACI|nr:spore germination protein [Rossellomorea vietnamensis]TYS00389.1 spore germination protein [Rossellomorea vietnamensis]